MDFTDEGIVDSEWLRSIGRSGKAKRSKIVQVQYSTSMTTCREYFT